MSADTARCDCRHCVDYRKREARRERTNAIARGEVKVTRPCYDWNVR